MKNISKGNVLSLKIPQHPLNEQRRIVAHLDELQAKVDGLKKYQAQSGQELDTLLPSVLDRAFRGELWSSAAWMYSGAFILQPL